MSVVRYKNHNPGWYKKWCILHHFLYQPGMHPGLSLRINPIIYLTLFTMMKYASSFRLGLSVLSLSLCSLMVSAQDSAIMFKRNKITFKPAEWMDINLRFNRTPKSIYTEYYGFGAEYERLLKPGSRWAFVVPVSMRQTLDRHEKATAIYVYPGIKYYTVQKRLLQYAIGLHAGVGRQSGPATGSMYGEVYYPAFRNVTGMIVMNHTLSVSLSRSLSIGLEAGLSFGIVDFYKSIAPYLNPGWSRSYGPYTNANSGLVFAYTF